MKREFISIYPHIQWEDANGQEGQQTSVQKGGDVVGKTIIPIPRVKESWIMGLIRMGVLGVSGDGLCCREAVPRVDRRMAAHRDVMDGGAPERQ